MAETELHRLPRSILPCNYHITLTPNFDNWTFKGQEVIDLNIISKSKEIVFNAADIEILRAKFNEAEAEVSLDKERERVTLSFPSEIDVGSGKLNIEYTGTLNDDMKGFYRSTYKDDSGNEVKMAVTQFEASDARRAFPCWDEPNIKATFDISLIVPKDKVALSNMPIKSQENVSENLIKYDYEKSPVMSTYVLAIVIGDLDYVESQDSNGVKVRVYTAKNKSNRGKFALDVCCKTLPFYATYFNIAYPLPKMDLVAIPDFAAGAMENWGLVTYRETMLLVDEAESSTMCRQIVALVVGHECAHMWFGNLVTMDWWTDLWLNEGFATWIEYLCVDYCYPEFDIWTEFASSEYARALELDSLKSSHPIQVTVHKPSEIDEIFDAISYSKGASIIRMLNDYLGNDKFRAGLASYLQKHKYANAVTADLWQALSVASNVNVAEIMDTWTKQMGFPVISVESIQDGAEGQTTSVKLTQRRFLSGGVSNDACDQQYWIIPVSVCAMNQPKNILAKFVMKRNGEAQVFKLPQPVDGFVKINPEAIGYYYTQYQSSVLPNLIQTLTSGALGPRERLSLEMDQFALARSGVIPTVDALDIARGYKSETNFTVWSNLLSNIATVTSIVKEANPVLIQNIERFYCDLLTPIYKNLGWNSRPNESHNDKMLRPMILRILGKNGHQEVVQEANKRFEQHHRSAGDNSRASCGANASCPSLPADLRGAVYSTVLKHGSEGTLNQMMELLIQTDLHEERMRIMGSLGSVPHTFVPRIYEFALSDQVRKQDKYRVLLSTVKDPESRAAFWEFFQTNWTTIRQQVTNNHMLGHIVKGGFEDFVTQERHDELQSFLNTNAPDLKRPVEQMLENIKINIAHLQRDSSALCQFFQQY